jgi:hypothetical protein
LKDSIKKDGYPSALNINNIKNIDDSFIYDLEIVINDELRNLVQIISML